MLKVEKHVSKLLYPKRRIESYSIMGTIVSPSKILLMCLGLRKNRLALEGLGLFALRFVDFGEASLAGRGLGSSEFTQHLRRYGRCRADVTEFSTKKSR